MARMIMARTTITLAALILGILLLPGAGQAQTAPIPQHIVDRLDRAVVEARSRNAGTAQRRAAGATLPGDSHAASVAVISVAERPDLAEPIVRYLTDALPEARPRIVATVAQTFPAFRDRVETSGAAPRNTSAVAPGTIAVSDGGYWYDQPALAAYRTAPVPRTLSVAATPSARLANVAGTGTTTPDSAAARIRLPATLPPLMAPEDPWDPLKPLNLFFYSINQVVDLVALRPAAWILDQAPEPVQDAASNLVRNYSEPITFLNDVLQGQFGNAGQTLGRFALNTTLGLGGLFDVADMWFGWEPHRADFGQTLHAYGLPPGPYLVLPVLGPTTLRDGIGQAADIAADPFALLTGPKGRVAYQGTRWLTDAMDAFPASESIRNTDGHYTAQRDMYYRLRAIELSQLPVRRVLSVHAPDSETPLWLEPPDPPR